MIQTVLLSLIDPSPFETREEIKPLATAKKLGILSPLLVRKKMDGRFELISGHRRCDSLKRMGERSAPCKVLDMDDERAAIALFAENNDREDLTDFAKGEFFSRFMKRFGLSTREAGEKLGVDHSAIVRCVGIVETFRVVEGSTTLSPDLYKHVVTEVKFKQLSKLPEEKKVDALTQVTENEFSASETEALVSEVKAGRPIEQAANEILLARETRKAKTYTERRSRKTCPTCSGRGWILIGEETK